MTLIEYIFLAAVMTIGFGGIVMDIWDDNIVRHVLVARKARLKRLEEQACKDYWDSFR